MGNKLAVLQTAETIKELEELDKKMKTSIEMFKQLSAEVEKANTLFAKGTPKEYLEALKAKEQAEKQIQRLTQENMKLAQQQAKIELDQARAKRENAKASEYQAKAEKETARAREVNQRIAIKEERENERNTAILERKRQALEKSLQPYQQLVRQMNEAKDKAKQLGAEMALLEQRFKQGEITQKEYNAGLKELGDRFVDAKTKALGLDAQVKNIDKAVGDSQRNVGNYGSALNGLKMNFQTLLAGFGVSFGIQAFTEVVKSSYDTIKDLNAQNYALKEVFETEAQVAAQKEYLSRITDQYGLELQGTTEAYTKYSAAVKGTALEGAEAQRIFTNFSAASSKLGLSAENQKGIFRALEQMISKGKVQAEELRLQLGDRMSGAFKLFASAIGVSADELDKMLKDGKVFSADTLPAVATELEKVYNLSERTETLTSAQNRLTNAWVEFLDKLSTNEEIVGLLSVAFKGLEEIMGIVLSLLVGDELDESASLFQQLWEIVVILFEALGELGITTENVSMLLKSIFSVAVMGAKTALEALKMAIGGVIDFIRDLIGIITGDWDNAFSNMEKRARSFVNNFTNIVKDFETQQKKLTATPQELDQMRSDKKYRDSWKKAQKDNQAYFQHEGKYYSTKTGKNTLKTTHDYIDKDGELVLKTKLESSVPDDDEKKKKKKKKKSAGKQKDQIDLLKEEKENQIAYLRLRRISGKISEEEFYKSRIETISQYSKKIQNLLNQENKLSAEVRKKAVDEQEKNLKDQYDYHAKILKEQHENTIKALEQEKKAVEESDRTALEKLEELMDINNRATKITDKHYKELLAMARQYKQDEKDIIKEANDQILKQEEEMVALLKKSKESIFADLEYNKDIAQLQKDISAEEQKRIILADKRLTESQKEYAIKILELQVQQESNQLEIEKLEQQREFLKNQTQTKETAKELLEIEKKIAQLKNENTALSSEELKTTTEAFLDKYKGVSDAISEGFRNLGLDKVADQFGTMFSSILTLANGFTGSLEEKQKMWLQILSSGVQMIADFSSKLITAQKDRTIALLDEELNTSAERTNLEIDFINKRLEAYTNMSDLTAEQIEERNALEDEARVLQEQQWEREKRIKTQKALAEQKAQAQQALIDGASGAVKSLAHYGFTPAGYAAALASIAFAGVQSMLIQSRNPVPQYFVGRKGGKRELAFTQERGAEMITDRYGNIKTLGHNKGATLTQLEQGDRVYTALETQNFLKGLPNVPSIGDNLYHQLAIKDIQPILLQEERLDYDKLARKIGEHQERIIRKYDKPVVYEEGGYIYKQEGGKLPIVIGRKERQTSIRKSNERN